MGKTAAPVLASSTGRNMETPWGPADYWNPLGNGVYSCSTSSHGGLFVPSHLLAAIPASHRAFAKRWSGSEQWYEEDCCWACVAAAFPELFTVEQRAAAMRTLEHYIADGTIKRSE